MCLAIYKPSKAQVDWDALEEGFRCNSHGAGFVTAHKGVLEVHKGFFTFDAFREAYLPHAHKQAAIHFRLATHGDKNDANCHPFSVTDEIAMIHNGILSIDTSDAKEMSDTWHYVEYVLKPLALENRDFYSHGAIKFLGEAAISGSKFVFLRADGDWDIWNQEDGHWKDDMWYSNRSYVKSAFGFSQWPKAAASVVLDEPLIPDSEADDSRYYHWLSDDEQAIYDSLLAEGFTVDELDSELAEYRSLRHMDYRGAYDEEIT
jgi:hypothetical protein